MERYVSVRCFSYQVQNNIPSWRVVSRVSAHRDSIENIDKAMILSKLPTVLELEDSILLQEVAMRRR